VPSFRIDYSRPGDRNPSGRPSSGALIGPYPSLEDAKADALARNPGAQITGATQLPD
jgi:hypothetical protein